MDFDVPEMIGAVTRTLTTRDRDGRPAWVSVHARTYDTSIDDLWDALTDPERIPRWFLPVSGDLHEGGHYQLEGNAGGTITRCRPPDLLQLTWEYGGDISWVTVRLAGQGDDACRLELEHVAHPDDRWDLYGPGATGVGWDLSLVGLALHLATRAAVDPNEFAAWTASADGHELIRGSSDGWCQASIDAGTDPDAARSAAAETLQAYTAPPT
jgi:uncharacterized protein YndB with AHSA1/START domain